jgi:hypothetical protein
MLTYKQVRLVIITRKKYVEVIIFEVIGEMKMRKLIWLRKRKVYVI